MQVINTGDYRYLYKARIYKLLAPDPSLVFTWGDILLEYGKLDHTSSIQDAFEKDKYIKQLENAYTTIKAMIRKLMFVVDKRTILDLHALGYIIDTTDSREYAKSLSAADKKSNSLVTRIRMLKNELKGDHSETGVSFDSLMAMLNSQLQINVPENISVARYCEYKKIITERNKKNAERTKKGIR